MDPSVSSLALCTSTLTSSSSLLPPSSGILPLAPLMFSYVCELIVSPGEEEQGQLLPEPELLPVLLLPTGTQYGPEPFDLADCTDLTDFVVPLLFTAPTGTLYSYSSSLFR